MMLDWERQSPVRRQFMAKARELRHGRLTVAETPSRREGGLTVASTLTIVCGYCGATVTIGRHWSSCITDLDLRNDWCRG